MARQTPLYATHAAAGAKLVDFAGWDMPLHYGSQIEEHHQVRRDAGMFDVSHMLIIDLEGADTRPFLRGLLANNVDKLHNPGKALYSCMLNEAGGVMDDLIVYFFREDRFRLVVNAGTADKDVAWIERQAAGRNVALKPRRDLAMIAVQGPRARAKTWQALPGAQTASAALKPFSAAWHGEVLIARTGYTGEDGFELMLPASRATAAWNALAAAGVKPAGLGARDTLRLEAGMNLYGQDMDETTSPLESGLAWTVDLAAPRDFVGKAALLAHPAQRHLVGLVLLDKGVLRAHQKVFAAGGEGEITSGSFSPTMNQSIALARLPAAAAAGDTVEVEIRDKRLKAKIVKPPFVRNGQVLV
ncbi:MAG: glycine cleavage system aminomethyltransferase GcvT [Pseudomonadota bacterium]|jgi:aminomethyltransferase